MQLIVLVGVLCHSYLHRCVCSSSLPSFVMSFSRITTWPMSRFLYRRLWARLPLLALVGCPALLAVYLRVRDDGDHLCQQSCDTKNIVEEAGQHTELIACCNQLSKQVSELGVDQRRVSG